MPGTHRGCLVFPCALHHGLSNTMLLQTWLPHSSAQAFTENGERVRVTRGKNASGSIVTYGRDRGEPAQTQQARCTRTFAPATRTSGDRRRNSHPDPTFALSLFMYGHL